MMMMTDDDADTLVTQIFVETNNGADYSAISSLKVFGTPIQGTDVNKIQKHTHE